MYRRRLSARGLQARIGHTALRLYVEFRAFRACAQSVQKLWPEAYGAESLGFVFPGVWRMGELGTVKIMVPFAGPNTGPNLGDPKWDHNFDNHPNEVFRLHGHRRSSSDLEKPRGAKAVFGLMTMTMTV